jgi:catechol 2,3-dioxygenase-like lactoylglutathione lyase family enzyme
MRVSHVMLGVSDLDRSLEFYRDKLGFTVQQQLPGFVFLDGGSVTLALSKDIWAHLGRSTGASQVVLGVDAVKAIYTALKSKGVEFMNEPRDVNGREWAANFRDPDGHLLSIFGPPGE